MDRKLKLIAIAVVLAAIAGVLVWHFGSADRKTENNVENPTAGKTARVAPRPQQRQTRVPNFDVLMDADSTGTLRLEGQVVDAEFRPVAGATVTIDSNPPREAKTEEDGSFYFDKLVGRPYTLVARADEGAAGPVDARLTETSAPVILHLKPVGSLEVMVVGAEDALPIAGAEVEIRGFLTVRVTADADGVARIPALPAGRYRLAAWAAGFAKSHSRVRLPSGSATHRERITLKRGAPVSGRVVRMDGSPVAGAQVVYESASDWAARAQPRYDSVTSDENGAFRFASLAAGTFRFNARHDTLAPGQSEPITLDGRTEVTDVVIQVEEGATIAGRVVMGDGTPAGWARVRVAASGGRMRWQRARQTFADEDGEFKMSALSRKAMQVVALHENATSETRTVDLEAQPRQSDIELVLELDGVIAGIVVDSRGEPVEGAQVRLRPDFRQGANFSRGEFRLRDLSSEMSDSGGRFEFRGLRKDPYVLNASPPGTTARRRGGMRNGVPAQVGDTNVEIVLEASGSIRGKVAFSDGSTPDMYTVSTGGWGGTSMPFSNKDGSFVLGELQPRTYRLTIRGPGFDEKRLQDIEVKPGSETDVGTIEVRQGRKITGRVVGAGGEPIANATVLVGRRIFGSGASSQPSGGRFPGARNIREATSDESGDFVVYGVAATELVIVAEHETKGRSTTRSIPRSSESVSDVQLVILRPGALEGTVTASGKPADGVMVSAQSQTVPDALFTVSTGADGKYRFDVLAPDSYLVSATSGGFRQGMGFHSKAATVASGETARVDISADAGEVDLVVKPTAGGSEVNFAWVYGVDGTITAKTLKELDVALANRDGGFSSRTMVFAGREARMSKLVPGDYTVCVVPYPAEVTGRAMFEYSARMSHALKAFCVATTVAVTPAEQSVGVPVEIPAFVPEPG